jgi:rhodanese-related sulfurtransferase
MRTLTASDLDTMQQKGDDFLLVNTLDQDKFADTKIEGAVNIPLSSEDFAQRVENQAGGKDQPVVVYCASKECHSSTKAAEKLDKAGFGQVYDFEDGAKGWKDTGHRMMEM